MSVASGVRLHVQRLLERELVIHAALVPFLLRGAGFALLQQRRRAVRDLSQVHRTARSPLLRKVVEPYVIANRGSIFESPAVAKSEEIAQHFGRRLAVLKAPGPRGERGVLYVMFSEMLRLLFATMDLRRLVQDYTVVIEPSWSGYCDEDLLRFSQFPEAIFVLAAQRDDHSFLERLDSNLVPVRAGPCDWVDPRVAEPFLGSPKAFDIVMNAHWGAWKRHHVLFRMLRAAAIPYRVALIGGAWGGRTRQDVEALARDFGVRDQLTIFENLPYAQVMEVTCRSRVSILLSLKEGSNRAIAESIFCDVPVVVLSNHVGGIVKNVVPETGVLVRENELEAAIRHLRDTPLRPRRWGLDHVSCFRTAEKLNALLREHALSEGRPWTHDIAVRANSPESRYVDPVDAERLEPWNHALRTYLSRQPALTDRNQGL